MDDDIKLWMDDIRDHPDGWHRTYKVEDTIEALKTGKVKFASLDHDLGVSYNQGMGLMDSEKDPTGFHVVKWMVDNNVWPPAGLRIHTDNTTGRGNMARLIEEHGPYKHKFYESWGNIVYTP